MKRIATQGFAIFLVLGISSSIGAVSHGNNPALSISLAVISLIAIAVINWRRK